MSTRSTKKRRLADGLLLATLVLSALGAAFFFLMLVASGAAASGSNNSGGQHSALLLIGCLAAFSVSTIGFLWRWLGSRISEHIIAPLFQRQPPRRRPPACAWACYVCDTSNLPGQDNCLACGSTSHMSAPEVAEAKRKLATEQELTS